MSLVDGLYSVQRLERKTASQVLADAFSEKPALKKLEIPIEDLRNMFEMMIRFGLRYGKVYAPSADLEGIMVILPEKYALLKSWQMIRSGAIFPVMKIKRKLMQILKETGEIIDEDRKNLTIGPYIYLISIGVGQGHQGKGSGGTLLDALIEKAEKEKKAIYLETDTRENVDLYRHYGFKVIKELMLPDLQVPMWEMAWFPSEGSIG